MDFGQINGLRSVCIQFHEDDAPIKPVLFCHALNFTNAFTSAPGLLAAMATYDGRDNAHLRYTNLTATGAQVKIEEDTTLDSEVVHSTEIVVYLVIEGQGVLTGTQVVP